MADEKQTMIAKVAGIGAAFAAAWLAQKLLASAWKAATGHTTPKPEDEGDVRFAEIAIATALSGAIVAVVRVVATRGAAKYFSTGSTPSA